MEDTTNTRLPASPPSPAPTGSAPRPQVVCLCGSTRFADQHAISRWELERTGKHICLMINYLPAWYAEQAGWNGLDHYGEAAGCKSTLDELHKRKIDLCDWVLVINVGGYIGDSTRAEIAYAQSLGKPVTYLEQNAKLSGGGPLSSKTTEAESRHPLE